MKSITAYVDGLKLSDLTQELQSIGVKEINVIEYFIVSPKISRLKFFCEDNVAERVQTTICSIGTTGTAFDHYVLVLDCPLDSQQPIRKRISPWKN